MDDLDRYIDRRFGKSGKGREAFDEGRQQFMNEVAKAIKVDASTQKKMDSVAKSWKQSENRRI
ncbi:MAG: hypothetical protein V2I43_18695 [Parvularcula sp.]|jgi:hypothetical protein|nr:hypothetical protein [Parvularcula sp.]